jgi:FAD dependent oxidoreductase TIGR03364
MNYDVICIGAGVLGTFHAYFSALKDKKVLLIERDYTPFEGTVRNFGQCVPSGQAFPEWRNFGVLGMNTYKTIQAKTDISVRQNGTCYIASDVGEMTLLQEAFERDKQSGYKSFLLSKNQVLEKFSSLRSDYPVGALFYPEEISLEPRSAISRIIDFVQKSAVVEFRPNTTVVGCERKNGCVRVTTSAGDKFTAGQVFLCSGREFKILFPSLFFQSGISLCKLQMMITKPMPEVHLPGNILTGYSIRRYEGFHSLPSYTHICAYPKNTELENEWGIHLLFKQAADGSVIIGDSHEYAPAYHSEKLDFGINMYVNNLMLREAQNIMRFPSWDIDSYRNGYYSTHPDGIYNITADEGIQIVTGIGGKGMTTSAGFAEYNVHQILG